jgi:hypothetical protein
VKTKRTTTKPTKRAAKTTKAKAKAATSGKVRRIAKRARVAGTR